jgi:hypothetical protein
MSAPTEATATAAQAAKTAKPYPVPVPASSSHARLLSSLAVADLSCAHFPDALLTS